MLSLHTGLRLAAIASATALLAACKTFSPDGGMGPVAAVAGQGLNKDVVRVASPADAAHAQTEVMRLLRAPLNADAAVQIALYNNLGLQAAYNRLGISEAVAVQKSRPPLPSFAYEELSTSVELDIERKIIGSILALATWPSRAKIAGVKFEQAQLQAVDETLRVAADTRRAYVRAVAARETAQALEAEKTKADAAAVLAAQLKQTGALNTLEQARRQVVAVELDAQLMAARQQADAAEEQLTRMLGLWGRDIAALLPSRLPALPAKRRGLGAVEQAAMDNRVDLQIALLETEALARSFGLTRRTRFINVLEAGGISKTQKDTGERKASGDGFEIAFEVPLYDFGRARVREAEQRYLEAVNTLGALAVNARSEAREAYGTYRSTYAIAARYEREVLPLRRTITEETELQYNAMQVDAFVLLEAARANATAKVAAIAAKRNFWLAYTELSVATLGGGAMAPTEDMTLAADSARADAH